MARVFIAKFIVTHITLTKNSATGVVQLSSDVIATSVTHSTCQHFCMFIAQTLNHKMVVERPFIYFIFEFCFASMQATGREQI